MNNDSTVTPAPLKKISSLLHASRTKGLVEKRPGEFFLSVQLKSASSAHSDVLQAIVRVRLDAFISPVREKRLAGASLQDAEPRGDRHCSLIPTLWPQKASCILGDDVRSAEKH